MFSFLSTLVRPLLERTETELVERARQGDREAFGELYERYLDPIYRFIFYKTGNRREAEDLTETVFLKAWEALKSYQPDVLAFKPWIYRIARNSTIDHYRTRKQHLSLESQLNSAADGDDLLEQVELNQRIEQLRDALEQLRPLYRDVLLLRFISGLSHAEAATILEQSEGNLRVLQYRALKALRQYFEV